ncbi:hypothetical protein Dda_8288 [Drechslerella dactyloides]|uniref:Uncharacterized protein n=1 Tax=Drechslerella dactyloides TaxID=74499 RepID=A0AAD6IRT9_DREDA|nr:hypothetical protein Dda_8288 [Drechslerella dactyloides]
MQSRNFCATIDQLARAQVDGQNLWALAAFANTTPQAAAVVEHAQVTRLNAKFTLHARANDMVPTIALLALLLTGSRYRQGSNVTRKTKSRRYPWELWSSRSADA